MRYLVMVALVSCGGSSSSNPDAPVADTARPDAPIDGAITDDCPHRTAPLGEPSTPVNSDEIVLGDVQIRNALDVQALAGTRVITGNLLLADTRITDVELPELEVVGGRLSIANNGSESLVSLRLPALESANEVIVVADWPGQLSVPRLELVGFASFNAHELDAHCIRSGPIGVGFNTATSLTFANFEGPSFAGMLGPDVTSLQLPSLNGSVAINFAPSLASIAVRSIAGELTLFDLPALATIEIATPGDVTIASLSKLPSLTSLQFLAGSTVHGVTLGVLPQVTSTQGLEGLTPVATQIVVDATAITTLALPTLTTVEHNFDISQNAGLSVLTAPQLTRVGELNDPVSSDGGISANPMLPSCYATQIRTQISGSTDLRFTISGNTGTGTCP